MRLLLTVGESRAHRFQKYLKLAEQQVIFVAEVKIKGGSADGCAIQHFLDCHIVERLFVNQRHQSTAEPRARPSNALIDLSPSLRLLRFSVDKRAK